MGLPRIGRVFGAVNVGSFRISAMIMGVSETGELVVLGSGHPDVQRSHFEDQDLCERAAKAKAMARVASVATRLRPKAGRSVAFWVPRKRQPRTVPRITCAAMTMGRGGALAVTSVA